MRLLAIFYYIMGVLCLIMWGRDYFSGGDNFFAFATIISFQLAAAFEQKYEQS